jgi:hypothetical protein
VKFIPYTRNALSFGSSKLRARISASRRIATHSSQISFYFRHGRGGKAASKFTELGDGRKYRALLAKPGRYTARIPILDEPTNHFDVEGIDALAKAMNESEGRMSWSRMACTGGYFRWRWRFGFSDLNAIVMHRGDAIDWGSIAAPTVTGVIKDCDKYFIVLFELGWVLANSQGSSLLSKSRDPFFQVALST